MQREAESLRHFMARFAQATLNIPNLHLAVSMHALLVGLCPGKFLDTLYAEPPEDMDQWRARAANYMNIEENTDARRKSMKTPTMTTFSATKKESRGDLKIIPFERFKGDYATRGLQLRVGTLTIPSL